MRRTPRWLALPVILGLIGAPARAQDATLARSDSATSRTTESPAQVDSRAGVVPSVPLTWSGSVRSLPEVDASPSAQRGAPPEGLRAGVAAPHTAATVEFGRPLMAPDRAHLGQARAMMIVGGAAVVLGAIIGDTPGTIFMVGGAVVGLVGLFQYLQ